MFITFEGIEGCGKSTLLSAVSRVLSKSGREIVTAREPGGTALGNRIRTIFLEESLEMKPLCEAFLISASRAQLVQTVIQPALQRGSIVLSDRYCDSTVAYQGYGRGLQAEMLVELCKLSTAGVMPDLTFFIDIPVGLSRERIGGRAQETGNAMDRMENEDAEFYVRVREGYLQLAKDCARIVVLDGCMSPQKLLAAAMHKISNR